jgi:hypothetical protein
MMAGLSILEFDLQNQTESIHNNPQKQTKNTPVCLISTAKETNRGFCYEIEKQSNFQEVFSNHCLEKNLTSARSNPISY